MECDVCGATEDLIKTKNEEGHTIFLCQLCHDAQIESLKEDEDTDEEDKDWTGKDEEDDDDDFDDDDFEDDEELIDEEDFDDKEEI